MNKIEKLKKLFFENKIGMEEVLIPIIDADIKTEEKVEYLKDFFMDMIRKLREDGVFSNSSESAYSNIKTFKPQISRFF